MANYNKVILAGNLTRDPQTKNLPSGMSLCEFGLAVNRKWKDQNGNEKEEVLFVDCTAFGKTAEVISQYCQKGKSLLVDGRLKYDSWEDKNGGGKRSKLTVVVENFQFMGGKQDGESGGQTVDRSTDQTRRPAGGGRSQRAPGTTGATTPLPEGTFDEDSIPF